MYFLHLFLLLARVWALRDPSFLHIGMDPVCSCLRPAGVCLLACLRSPTAKYTGFAYLNTRPFPNAGKLRAPGPGLEKTKPVLGVLSRIRAGEPETSSLNMSDIVSSLGIDFFSPKPRARKRPGQVLAQTCETTTVVRTATKTKTRIIVKLRTATTTATDTVQVVQTVSVTVPPVTKTRDRVRHVIEYRTETRHVLITQKPVTNTVTRETTKTITCTTTETTTATTTATVRDMSVSIVKISPTPEPEKDYVDVRPLVDSKPGVLIQFHDGLGRSKRVTVLVPGPSERIQESVSPVPAQSAILPPLETKLPPLEADRTTRRDCIPITKIQPVKVYATKTETQTRTHTVTTPHLVTSTVVITKVEPKYLTQNHILRTTKKATVTVTSTKREMVKPSAITITKQPYPLATSGVHQKYRSIISKLKEKAEEYQNIIHHLDDKVYIGKQEMEKIREMLKEIGM